MIRNFVFMQLAAEDQHEFHEHHWRPFERLFDTAGDQPAVALTPFYRDFLMRGGTFSRLRATFVDFKQYYDRTKQTPASI